MNSKPVIMIVDDEIANIELVGAMLEQEYEILFARSGEQALNVARRSTPDLILLDVVMPGLDGYETCRLLKQDPGLADVPVIFTTGRNGIEDEERGLAAGAIDYVTKPVQPISLRHRVGNHVNLKQMRDRLVNLAMIDPLTGLGNRRMLDRLMSQELARLGPDRAWLSVILLDVDYFKKYNDIYGHPAGDLCLTQVARALGGTIRNGRDHCTRYGGEEFACILPQTGLADAMDIADRMRRSVEALSMPHAGSDVVPVVTISAGVISGPCAPGQEMSFWIEQADRLLYQSKQSGRNRVSALKLEES